jgi:hypothetical protein
VFDASVGSKLFVTLGLVFPLHFIKRIASDTSGREAIRIALDDLKPSKYYAENTANLAGQIGLRRGGLYGTLGFSCTIVPIRTD